MILIRYIPLMGIVLIIYNVLTLGQSGSGKSTLEQSWQTIYLPSGEDLTLTYSEALIILALFVLFIEIIKSTSASNQAIAEQIFSVLVFIGFLVQFLNSNNAAEPTFLILLVMSLVEVLASFVIQTKVARRDINFGG